MLNEVSQPGVHELSEASIVDVLGGIYDAALDPDAWTEALRKIALTTNSAAAGLVLHNTRQAEGSVTLIHGIGPEYLELYNTHYGNENVVLRRAFQLELTKPGVVRISDDFYPKRELERTEYYNDFLSRAHIEHGLGCTLLTDESWISTLTLQRGRRAGPFGEAESSVVRVLYPHLRRALQIYQRLSGSRVLADATSEALDAAAVGVLLLDIRGRVVARNRAAASLVERNDGIGLSQEGLIVGRTPRATAALRGLVEACLQLARGRGLPSGRILLLARPSGLRPLQVMASPVRSPVPALTPLAPSAVLLITDPEAQPTLSLKHLQALWGLTRAEAGMAALLARGLSMREAAGRLAISYETARTHLKHLFEKTDTHRQGELVKQLLQSAVFRERGSAGFDSSRD